MKRPTKKEVKIHGHEECPECKRIGFNECIDAYEEFLFSGLTEQEMFEMVILLHRNNIKTSEAWDYVKGLSKM